MARYALVIGISKYDKFTHLPKAATDAEAIAQLLEQHRYTVIRLPRKLVSENQWAIDPDKRLTAAELSTELKTFLRDRATRQEVVIYFAGHGFRVTDTLTDEEVGYLATSDATKEGQNAVRVDALNTLLSKSDLGSLVMLLDCCYAGTLIEQRSLLQPTQGIISQKQNYCLIAACRDFERAREGEQHGIFTAAVLRGLSPENAANGDITSTDLLGFISRVLQPSGQEVIHAGMGQSIPLVAYQPTQAVGASEQRERSHPTTERSPAEQCQAYALAQKLQAWFETLGYRFERHEVWAEDSFEWIINIPVRRNRYDRVLVRGINGEAGLRDIAALRQSVMQQRTDEGWLVTTRRISRAAREAVEQAENELLGCYTLDELLDQDADFSGYLTWLEAEIQQREIESRYVPLACTKEEFDPETKQRMGVSRYDERDGWIDGYIDLWLDDPAKEHLSVLGEFGTGKTWFAFHYAWKALQRYKDAQRRGVERPRLPLVIPLRDYAKAVSVESLFSEFFFRKHEIPIPGYTAFEQLNRMGKLLLIFDGFDEMAARVDRQQMINNFWELAKVVVPGAKVILTCRTEHFPEAKEGQALLNAELKASTANLTGETPQFEVMELEKFNDEQIQQVLSLRTEPGTIEQVMSNPQLLDLARRPVMTELILEALPDIEAGKPVDMSRVYLYAVRRKMEHDIKEKRTFTSLAEKLYFLCELSWEMLSNDRMSLNYREFPDRIRRLFSSVVQEERDLDHWHYDMMGQTMLIRNANGDYMPAHRSLLEFFVAYKFAIELDILAPDFLEIAEDIPAFAEELNLSNTFGKEPLTKAIFDLMLPILEFGKKTKERLLAIIVNTKKKKESEVKFVGGNAATLLLKIDPFALEGTDLSNSVVIGADFSNASLRNVNFSGANMTHSVFTKVFSNVFSVALSPDNKLLAVGDFNNGIHLWRVEDTEHVLTYSDHSDLVWSIAFSPNGQTLASASGDQTVKIWDVHTGQCLRTLRGQLNELDFETFSPDGQSVSFSPDGQTLASASGDPLVRLWDTTTGQCKEVLAGHTRGVQAATFSSDGLILATGGDDQTIRLWDLHTSQCLRVLQEHTDAIQAATFSPSGQILASASRDQTVKIWDISTGQCLRTLRGHTHWVQSVAFSPDSCILASGSEDQTIRLWDVRTGKCLKILSEHTNWVRSVTFSSDGYTLVSGGGNQMVKFWDTRSGQCLKTLHGFTNSVRSITFSQDGSTLASGSEDQTVKIWNVRTGQCERVLQGFADSVRSVAFCANKRLASANGDETIGIWDTVTGQCIQNLNDHTSSVRSLTFSQSKNILASSSGDRTIKLWDINTGQCLRTLHGHTSSIYSVVFSPDGSIIASGSEDCTIKLWSVSTGECLRTLNGHASWVRSVVFHFGNSTIASGSEDRTIKLWDALSGQCLRTLHGHTGSVYTILSVTKNILIGGDSAGEIKIWDINGDTCLRTLKAHKSLIHSIALAPNSQNVASGSKDGTIKIWKIDTGECLRIFDNKPYTKMNITEVSGLSETEKAMLRELGAIENG